MSIVAEAALYARHVHEGQFRKGDVGIGHIQHLAEVATFVGAFGGDDIAIAAAWLHDAVEDTDVTLADIEERFGGQVAACVAEVTDDPDLDTAARHAAQIASAPFKSPRAALIKAADQVSNLRALVASPPGWSAARRAAYVEKAEAVVAGLAIPEGLRTEFTHAAMAARA